MAGSDADVDLDSNSESQESLEDCQSDSGLSQPELDDTAADDSKQQQLQAGSKPAGKKKAKQKQAGRRRRVDKHQSEGERRPCARLLPATLVGNHHSRTTAQFPSAISLGILPCAKTCCTA